MNRRLFFQSITGAAAVAPVAAKVATLKPKAKAPTLIIQPRRHNSLWQPLPKQAEALNSTTPITIFSHGRGAGATELGMAFLVARSSRDNYSWFIVPNSVVKHTLMVRFQDRWGVRIVNERSRVILPGESIIQFLTHSDFDDLDRLAGIKYPELVYVDQAERMPEDHFDRMLYVCGEGPGRRWRVGEPAKMLISVIPPCDWMRDRYIRSACPNITVVRSTLFDNSYALRYHESGLYRRV